MLFLDAMLRALNIGSEDERSAKASRDASAALLDRDFGLYFEPSPDDPVWKAITRDNAAAVQAGFEEIWRRASLDAYESAQDTGVVFEIPPVAAQVANRVASETGLSPVYVLLLVHQYVDADPAERVAYREEWLAKMVERCPCAPPPEAYVDHLAETYFSASN